MGREAGPVTSDHCKCMAQNEGAGIGGCRYIQRLLRLQPHIVPSCLTPISLAGSPGAHPDTRVACRPWPDRRHSFATAISCGFRRHRSSHHERDAGDPVYSHRSMPVCWKGSAFSSPWTTGIDSRDPSYRTSQFRSSSIS